MDWIFCFRKYIISAEEEIEFQLMQNWQWSNDGVTMV